MEMATEQLIKELMASVAPLRCGTKVGPKKLHRSISDAMKKKYGVKSMTDLSADHLLNEFHLYEGMAITKWHPPKLPSPPEAPPPAPASAPAEPAAPSAPPTPVIPAVIYEELAKKNVPPSYADIAVKEGVIRAVAKHAENLWDANRMMKQGVTPETVPPGTDPRTVDLLRIMREHKMEARFLVSRKR